MTEWVPWNDLTDGLEAEPIVWARGILDSGDEGELVILWRYLQTHWEVAKDLTTDISEWYQRLQKQWEEEGSVGLLTSRWAADKALSDPDKPELAKELVGVVTDVYLKIGKPYAISDETALAVLLATGDEKLLDAIRMKRTDLEKKAERGSGTALVAFEAGLTELEKPLAMFVRKIVRSGGSIEERAEAKNIISSLRSRGTKICLPHLEWASQQAQIWLSENPSHNDPPRLMGDPNDYEWLSYEWFRDGLATTIEAIRHRLARGDID